MTNYTKTTNFATKDTLPSGNANKIVKGTEIDTEFNNIATAVATKADTAGPTFTGTVTIPTVDLNGGAIDGTTVGASTAAAITGTTIVANTSINIAGDGATVTGIKDEDDMSSNSATKLATQQSIKAYVDSQVTAQDLDFQADSGGALSIDLDSETLTFTGGTGVDTSGSGNAVTFAIDSTVATLAGTQTLTNKTLTSPTLNTPTIGTSFTIGSATITEAELEILDGATVTTAELNVLDGITSTTAELNILDGVTSTAAELNILDGVTSTAAELNILDGVTATTAELNIMDGVTATTAELNYVDGVTSNVQTQLDAKAPIASPTFTGTVTVPGLTTSADILFGDNDKAIFGAGSDLQIFHDGSNSHITEGGTGDLIIRGANIEIQTGGGNRYFRGASNAARLYHTNNEKLTTTSTGIDVTGAVTADGLTVDSGTVDTVATFQSSGDANAYVVVKDSGSSGGAFIGAVGTHTILGTGGSTERMRIDSSGNVGIGRTPRVMLDVAGEVAIAYDATYGLRFYNQNQNNWSSIGNNIATGSSAANLVFKDSTGEVMRLSSGNVGIGTSSPSEKLTIAGDVQIGESSGGEKLKFVGASSKYNFLVGKQVNVDNAFEITPSTAAGGNTFSTPAVVVNSSGNVGIGTNSPYGALTVDTANGILNIANGNTSGGTKIQAWGATPSNGYLAIEGYDKEYARFDASGNLLVGKSSSSFSTAGIEARSGGTLWATADGTNAASFNRKTSDGAIAYFSKDGSTVGSIGVIYGDNLFIGGPNHSGLQFGTTIIYPTNGTSAAATDGAIDLGGSATRFKDIYLSGTLHGDKYDIYTEGGGSLYQTDGYVRFANGSTETARIDSSGNLLVGTTTTSSTAIGAKILPSGRLTLVTDDSGTQYPVTFGRETTGAVGSISTTASATAYNTSSDQRLKDNIIDAPSASDDIDAIQVRSFDWKADGSHQKYGMVAQELQSAAPEAVTGDADSDDMMGVDYSKLVPMMLKEIQSLRARVAQLEGEA